MKKTLSILLLLALVSQGCSKHHDHPASGTATVYVTGDDGTNPILWTNGKAQTLATSGGFGAQVLLNGSDVYVAGISGEDSFNNRGVAGLFANYTYWKNNVGNTISTSQWVRDPVAFAINGSDIYYSGGQAYKNGTLVTLAGFGGRGYLSAATSAGGNVYLAGGDSVGNGVYWKNGVMQVVIPNLTPSTGGVGILSIFVAGNDVYIGGTDPQQQAGIWKNGVEKTIHSFGGQELFNVRAIFVSGDDVYSTSNWVLNGANAPAYWKNGVQVNLPLNGATYGNANSIFVSGNDVYVAGTTSQGAVLWKNGVGTLLAAGGEANSVVVQ